MYSVIKSNEIMPYATIWMTIEIVIEGKISQRGRNIV